MSIAPFFRCSEINGSIDFYTRRLDFNVVQAPDPDPDSFMSMYASLERLGNVLHLSEHSGDGVFGSVIYVRVDDLDEIYNSFLRNGLVRQMKSGITMEPVKQSWGMKEFYVADPDGNRIRFGQPVS